MSKYDLPQLRGAWGAGFHAGAKKQAQDETIVGKFFHSKYEDGRIHWQGSVLSVQPDGFFLVQLYSWLDGRETDLKLIALADMVDWDFYNNEEQWVAKGNATFSASL